VCKILSESSKGVRGARVEHNRFCVTIHFRRVKEEVDSSLSLSLCLCDNHPKLSPPDVSHSLLCGKQSWGALAEKVENVLKDYPTLNLTHGRKVNFHII